MISNPPLPACFRVIDIKRHIGAAKVRVLFALTL